MSRFVCACGCERFDVEHEPPGPHWCKFVATCHACGAAALVIGTNDDGRLSLRITGRLRFADDDRPARTAATCLASYEFRGDACPGRYSPITVATVEADLRTFRSQRGVG